MAGMEVQKTEVNKPLMISVPQGLWEYCANKASKEGIAPIDELNSILGKGVLLDMLLEQGANVIIPSVTGNISLANLLDEISKKRSTKT